MVHNLGRGGAKGVSRHKNTGKWEAHIWDRCRKRQVYLGGYDDKRRASRAYDLAALVLFGDEAETNYASLSYQQQVRPLRLMPFEEAVKAIKSSAHVDVEETEPDEMILIHICSSTLSYDLD